MSNIIDRRKLLTSGVTFLGVCFTTGAGLAGSVGSESDRSSHEHAKQLDAIRYSQAAFLKLTHKELTYLYNYKIDGFREAMASIAVKMMLDDRASMLRLMQDMGKLETDADRKARLNAEMQHATNQVMVNNDAATLEQKRILRRAKRYKRGVKAWLKNPREGTFFAKCFFSVGSISMACKPIS